MDTIELVGGQGAPQLPMDLSRLQNRTAVVKVVRLLILSAMLAGVLFLQVADRHFIPYSVIFPVYLILSGSFLLNIFYLIFFEKLVAHQVFNALLHALDAVLIASIFHFIGTNQNFILFLFLLNIAMAGFMHGNRGAVVLSLWTSCLFSLLLILGPSLPGSNLVIALVLNNFAFFLTAWLSGYITDQFQFLGEEIETRSQDIAALKELNEMIVSNIGTGLVTVDMDGLIIHSNRAALRILSHAHLQGQNLAEIFPHFYNEMSEAFTPQLFEPSHGVHRREVNYRSPRGENLNLEVLVFPLLDVRRKGRGYILLVQDLTEVKRLEYQLRQKDKLAAVGQLAAGIAHEIRNPLASISGSVQLLATTFQAEGDENQKLMNIILREVDRLNHLISEFLEFVRPDEQVCDPINVNTVLSELLDMARVNERLRKGVEQKTALKGHKIILGDYNKLKQALLNIIINAYQAMENSLKPEISVQTYDKSHSVVVMIKDNGMGIEPDHLLKIFEPFHTTKPNGTGLGLAITHKILENHRARVFVDSEKGRGTVFTLEFPSASDSDQDEVAAKRQA